MITTVTINIKTGLGEVEDKFPGFANGYSSTWKEGDKTHNERFPPLPVISAAGETLTQGTWECEKITTDDWRVCGWNVCQVWKVIEISEEEPLHHEVHGYGEYKPTPGLPGKETTLDQHIAEMNTLMEGKETARKYPKGGVEEAAFFAILNSVSEAPHAWDIIPHFVNGAKFGTNWKKEHSIDSVDRDKVIAVIREYNNSIGVYDIGELIKRIKNI